MVGFNYKNFDEDLFILRFPALTTGIVYLLENMCSNAEASLNHLVPM